MSRRHSLETLFEKEAKAAGFLVKQAKSIRVKEPVKNSNGKKPKIVTNPDFFVIDPETKRGVHVEIGNGKGNNGHKAAQMRVIKKAGVENYVQLTGHQVLELKKTKNTKEKKSLLAKMLYLMLIF